MEIGLYKDWMKPQIAKLFSIQYKISEEAFSELMTNFYEHPFQKDKCIRIVALEGQTVIGFQSFFYWPYIYNGKYYNSYQSGNSLVHQDFRGQGIFQKLLNYLDIHRSNFKIDFLIGFPIDVSVGSLVRNKWLNILNLNWYIKILNPFSILLPLNMEKLKTYFPERNLFVSQAQEKLKVSSDKEFLNWRATLYDKNKYFSFHYKENDNQILFKLKINTRKKFIKELIIGDIIASSYKTTFLESALTALLKEIKKIRCLTILSIALNEEGDANLLKILSYKKFKPISKQIHFCVKPFKDTEILADPGKWIVYRGDIDTW